MIARPADAVSMNNTTTFDNPSIFTFEQIMEPLFTVSDDGRDVKPWLATGYTVSADKLTYTIKLRPGVTFSDGTPMTAKDVKFSIDADTATADTGWGYINAAIDERLRRRRRDRRHQDQVRMGTAHRRSLPVQQRDRPRELRRKDR